MHDWLGNAWKWPAILAAALALSSNAGCGGSDRAAVTGTVVRTDGTPLVGARVIARSGESGKSAYATTDEQGQYELGIAQEGDGIPPGNYDVVILEDLGDPDNRRPQTIADKYRNPATSGLRLSVEAGENAVLNVTVDPK